VDELKRVLKVIAVVVLLIAAALAGAHARSQERTGGLPTVAVSGVIG
jgi:hypothetical protein